MGRVLGMRSGYYFAFSLIALESIATGSDPRTYAALRPRHAPQGAPPAAACVDGGAAAAMTGAAMGRRHSRTVQPGPAPPRDPPGRPEEYGLAVPGTRPAAEARGAPGPAGRAKTGG